MHVYVQTLYNLVLGIKHKASTSLSLKEYAHIEYVIPQKVGVEREIHNLVQGTCLLDQQWL